MKKILIIILFIIICSTTFLFTKIETNEEVEEPIVLLEQNVDIKETIEVVRVEIKGEVLTPGVYELPINSRVIDLITTAGGLTENAVLTNINQAKKLTDEMVVVVYNKNDLVEEVKTEYVYLECTCPEVKNDACIEQEEEENEIKDNKISINNASIEELTSLSGIGEKTATKIIEYRKETPFETIEDIKKVSGIGDSLYEKIKDYITI